MHSQVLQALAKAIDSTITVSMGFDVTVIGFNAAFAIEFIFGEDGQFACADSTGLGFSLGLLGAGASIGVAISPHNLLGGWKTVGAQMNNPTICVGLGYSPGPFGIAAKAVFDPSQISNNKAVDELQSVMDGKLSTDFANLEPREAILEALSYVVPSGLLSVGVAASVGIDALEVVGEDLILPSVSVSACDERLTYCNGQGCADKLLVDPWADGTLCGLGTTCSSCKNHATYWYSKALTACGTEPKWEDGTLCGIGTTCNACLRPHTYWYSKGFTACGSEPKWSDGTVCAKGTTCNACAHPATYWWGKAFTACGSEPGWSDGTTCLAGTTCNACTHPATWWVGAAITKCGNEPCWKGGTVCGAGTTCNSCCSGANCPWYQFGVCTCN